MLPQLCLFALFGLKVLFGGANLIRELNLTFANTILP